TVTQTSDDGRFIVVANFNPLPDSLEVINQFGFRGMTWSKQIFLGACVLVPLFVLITLIVCVVSRVRRRWLWIIFILLGCFVQFELNWSNGEWTAKPLAFSLLGAGFSRMGLYGPW